MNARSFAGTTMSARGCWKKNMYQLRLQLVGVGEERSRHRRTRRDSHPDHLRPSIGCVACRAVHDRRPPVVADQRRAFVASEVFVERNHVESRRPGLDAAIGGHTAWCVAAEVRR